jgi:hypothetical protein
VSDTSDASGEGKEGDVSAAPVSKDAEIDLRDRRPGRLGLGEPTRR